MPKDLSKETKAPHPEDYVTLSHGDSCPITGKEAKPIKCRNEAAFAHNNGTGRYAFFSHIVVAAICCKHPDLTQGGV